MIQTRVLGLQTSHLLLIRTNLGYGTVLTSCHIVRALELFVHVSKPKVMPYPLSAEEAIRC
jgi:hypothetical protein